MVPLRFQSSSRFWLWLLFCLMVGGAGFALTTPPLAAQQGWRSPLIGDGSAYARGDFPEMPMPPAPFIDTDAPMRDPTAMPVWVGMVWQSARDGDYDIYYTDGGGGFVQLTNFPTVEGSPRLKPGGGQVVYVRENQLWVVNTDGTNNVQITHSGSHSRPTWSKDGAYIYYAGAVSGNNEIWRINADGTGETQITNDPAPDGYPVISPNGEWLAWIRVIDASYGVIQYLHLPTGQSGATGQCAYLVSIAWAVNTNGLYATCERTGDYWYDIVFTTLTGQFGTVVAGEFLNDRVLGSHVGEYTLAGDLYYNGYYYRIEGNELEVDRILVQRYTAATGGSVSVFDSGFDVNPDAIALDIAAPAVTMGPLPPLVRAYSPVSVRWGGTDTGGSGIHNYNVLYRPYDLSDYIPFLTDTSATATVCCNYSGGQDLHFKANAMDYAGNRSADSTPVSTHFYSFRETLIATDNRGYGMPNATGASGTITPPTQRGERTIYRDYNLHPDAIALSGYSVVAHAPVNTVQDRLLPVYGTPLDAPALLANGGFDEGLGGWEFSGTFTAAAITQNRHGGPYALRFAPDCNESCLTASVLPDINSILPAVAMAPDGTLHILWVEEYTIRHRTLRPDGTYSPIDEVGGTTFHLPHPVVDQNGTLHILYNSLDHVLYRALPANGSWSAPVMVGDYPSNTYDIGGYRLVADAQGRLHAIFRSCSDGCTSTYDASLAYRQRSAAGQWSAIEPIGIRASLGGKSVAISPDGTLRLLYTEARGNNLSSNLLQAVRYPNG